MRILKKIIIAALILLAIAGIAVWWITRPDVADYAFEETAGTDPVLDEPESELVPTVDIVKPIGWGEGETPIAAEGLVVTRFAEGLDHPRVLYTLPNGDVLVTLTNAPDRELAGGWLTNMIASWLFSEAGAGEPSPNQLVLLRDANEDGVAEETRCLLYTSDAADE